MGGADLRSIALSRTPAAAARPRIRGQCIAWYARLLPSFRWYSLCIITGSMCGGGEKGARKYGLDMPSANRPIRLRIQGGPKKVSRKLLFTPQLSLVLINRPRRDGTLSWRWYTAAVGGIRTHDLYLAVASPAPYHSATVYGVGE